ncbi:MAG: sulfatase [Puniceicoccaceae bacterium]
MRKQLLIIHSIILSVGLYANARPNIILIIGDDISPDFSCYGGQVETPHIDKLASSGLRFDNAYVTASSCSPSRCSIITGRYPHNTGAPELHMDLPEGQFMFPEALKKAGYYCAQYGKFHMGDYALNAFDVARDLRYPEDPTGAEGWVPMLKNRPKDKPFFMWFAAFDAHRPWEPDPLETPHDPGKVILPTGVPDTPLSRQDYASYLDEVRRFDRYVGGVVAELKRQGVYDNTLIFVLADNGSPFPRNKTSLYEGGMKTPLVAHWPKGKLADGAASESLISTIDLAPTILQVAGIPVPKHVQGKSMLPVLREPGKEIREALYGERNWHVQIGVSRMLRKGHFVYFRDFTPGFYSFQMVDHNKGAYAELLRLKEAGQLSPEQAEVFSTNRPEESLFNLKEDPNQLHNLVGKAEYTAIISDMRSLLADWQAKTGDSIPDIDEMTPDRHDRKTYERLYPGGRPPTGVLPGEDAGAERIGYD